MPAIFIRAESTKYHGDGRDEVYLTIVGTKGGRKCETLSFQAAADLRDDLAAKLPSEIPARDQREYVEPLLAALKAMVALPVNNSWSPAEIAARDNAGAIIAKAEGRARPRHSIEGGLSR